MEEGGRGPARAPAGVRPCPTLGSPEAGGVLQSRALWLPRGPSRCPQAPPHPRLTWKLKSEPWVGGRRTSFWSSVQADDSLPPRCCPKTKRRCQDGKRAVMEDGGGAGLWGAGRGSGAKGTIRSSSECLSSQLPPRLHTCVLTFFHTHAGALPCAHTNATHLCTHPHAFTRMNSRVCTHIHTNTLVHMCVYVCTHRHTHMHSHTCTHVMTRCSPAVPPAHVLVSAG